MVAHHRRRLNWRFVGSQDGARRWRLVIGNLHVADASFHGRRDWRATTVDGAMFIARDTGKLTEMVRAHAAGLATHMEVAAFPAVTVDSPPPSPGDNPHRERNPQR